jgi:DNA polymerase-3 subunit chi
MESLDLALWAEGFRPHGLAGGPHDDLQPVLLTTGPAGGCDCLVALDGAEVEPAEAGALKRILVVFGPEDLATARAQWRALTAAGLPLALLRVDGRRLGPAPRQPRAHVNALRARGCARWR